VCVCVCVCVCVNELQEQAGQLKGEDPGSPGVGHQLARRKEDRKQKPDAPSQRHRRQWQDLGRTVVVREV
jgi:hypothetical protein